MPGGVILHLLHLLHEYEELVLVGWKTDSNIHEVHSLNSSVCLVARVAAVASVGVVFLLVSHVRVIVISSNSQLAPMD